MFQASEQVNKHVLNLRREAANVQQSQAGAASSTDQRVTISSLFKEQVAYPILKNHFKRDEFLGRIKDIVYFLPFSRVSQFTL